MELSFVFAALKRRWWIVLIFAELGVLPFVLGGGPATTSVFESEARLEILAPNDARTTASQPDRYLLSQIEVLQSRQLAEAVAERLGDPDGVRGVIRSSGFEHVPETDVVVVSVRQTDAENARRVAQEIVDTYISNLRAAESALVEPDLARLDSEIAASRAALAEVNERIREAFAPYLSLTTDQPRQIPNETVLVPNEAAERQFLLADILRLEQERNALVNQPSQINTSVIQNATLPTSPITETGGVFEIAAFIGMLLLGISAALLWARFSPKVLDEQHAAEILGQPVVASLKKSKALKRDPLVAFTRLPQDLILSVDQIAVQAEALASLDRPLTIAVVGSQRGAASTTTSVALAARFAAAEYSVLLVDADRRDPWITEVFGAGDHGGVTALLGQNPDKVDEIFTRTSEPDVRVLGLGGSGASLRREAMPSLVEASRKAANIVIFDGGPLLDAASTVELCNVVDAVVLVIPLSDARSDDLAVVARQLHSIEDKVLPVLSWTTRSSAARHPVAVDLGADSLALGGGVVAVAAPADRSRPASDPDVSRADDDQTVEASTEPIGRQANGAGTSGRSSSSSRRNSNTAGKRRQTSTKPKTAPASTSDESSEAAEKPRGARA